MTCDCGVTSASSARLAAGRLVADVAAIPTDVGRHGNADHQPIAGNACVVVASAICFSRSLSVGAVPHSTSEKAAAAGLTDRIPAPILDHLLHV